ncbi:lipoprotein-anchoring transpeptidase ErfK/SrfK [Nocardioides daedukensis]|uniref:Lipoprotein-anchoring transpeptidase ErfK/SrfK n=1 Tax=Nocardioides daedukensis TaxID=634462 RepID=A0A7Y9RZ86_9ACTN|nr:Ig-like domain-containing protein [Nocardioides daedukensis]NYG58054.1 lipoprotein-anchoring transpeptidase ErfK/SrfK [Nocardioides daedukensis]
MTARPSSSRATRVLGGVVAVTLLMLGLGSCSDSSDSESAPDRVTVEETEAAAPVEVSSNVSGARAVPVDKLIRVKAAGGTLAKVVVRGPEGQSVAGSLRDDGSTWRASERLEPGTTYTIRSVTKNSDGASGKHSATFTTQDLSLDEQTYAAVAPLDGETVGVGMPVVVNFDLPVQDRARFEKHMKVTSAPAQKGSWHWVSDNEVHYRPADYWQAGTDVTVEVDINALPAGNGIYGQESRKISFHVGDSVISKVNAQTHQMKTYVNGKLVKTMPITTGKPGFTTRSGVKVIMQKFRSKRMNSETVGIPAGSAEAYDLDNVEYAMRVTSSGEFLHAAPWSVGSQGRANVSHGCTGLSTANAKWIYDLSKRGDVVEYTGTDRPMTLHNGYGDWNASFAEYAEASAL